MNLKQAQAVLSDFLMKCEDEGVALPDDPLVSVLAAIRVLHHEAKHEVGRPQTEAAFAQMHREFGLKAGFQPGKQKARTPRTKPTPSSPPRKSSSTTTSPKSRSTHKNKLQKEVTSQPARCSENQALVDQLMQLAEYERLGGHTQRAVARLRAARAVRDAGDEITSGAQARKLERVGPSAAAKIDTILSEGLESALQEYDEYEQA